MNILFIAYKIEKNKGSEDSTAYHVIPELIQQGCNITLITRQNNINKLKNDPFFSNVTFVAIELNRFLTYIKKYSLGMIIYYYLWQMSSGRAIKKLVKINSYSAIHQFNFHASWCLHFIPKSKSRIIFGLLTRHDRVPLRFWYGSTVSYLSELTKEFIKILLHSLNPLLLLCLQCSNIIYMGQKRSFYPYTIFKSKTHFLPQAASIFPIHHHRKTIDATFNIIFVGRLINLKGIMIALEDFEYFIQSLDTAQRKDICFTIIDSGPLEDLIRKRMNTLITLYGPVVRMYAWMNQADLKDHYTKAAAFLYPSFEGQGLVVTEAMAHQVPIICLEGSGPHDVAGYAAKTVAITTKEETLDNISLTLKRLSMEYWHHPESYNKRCQKSRERARELDWKNKASLIVQHYHD